MRTIKSVFIKWKELQPWAKIILGMVLGILCGFYLGDQAKIFQPLGTMFINAVMMMVTPVVFVSLVCGVIAMKDPVKMGRIALKTFSIYFFSMSCAASIAILLCVNIFNPGKGLNIAHSMSGAVSQMVNVSAGSKQVDLIHTLINIIPSNILTSFAEGNILQIIVFAILFGVSINFSGDAAQPVEDFFNSLSAVVFKLVSIVMAAAPLGIFGLMAVVAGSHGIEVIASLFKLVAITYACFFIVMSFNYGIGLSLAKLNPLVFFRKMFEAQIVAFSTTSSAATLPVNMKVAEHKLGVSKSIASFVLPLGSTVNMDGLATSMAVTVIFTANLYGIDLSMGDYVTVVLTTTIAAIGCAGVPAAALIVLPMILSTVGLPLEVIGLIAAINRIVDMMSTTMNITGDTFAAVVVAKTEGELDMDRYYDQYAQSKPKKPVFGPHRSILHGATGVHNRKDSDIDDALVVN